MTSSFTSVLLSALLQVVAVLALGVLWWLIATRARAPFFRWIGWHRPEPARPGTLALGAVVLAVASAGLGVGLLFLTAGGNATARFHGLGWAGLPAVLAYALVQTSLSEETLFRGLLLKRIAGRFGFWAGNLTQAVAFGLLHLVPFWVLLGPALALPIGLFTAGIGLGLGYLNERLAAGSIAPSWAMHALMNLVAGGISLFALA